LAVANIHRPECVTIRAIAAELSQAWRFLFAPSVRTAIPALSGNNQEFREERTRRSAEEAAAALGLIPTAFDRQVRDGVLALESVTVVGGRELYQREQIRRLILAT
jgi:hypothetical protein